MRHKNRSLEFGHIYCSEDCLPLKNLTKAIMSFIRSSGVANLFTRHVFFTCFITPNPPQTSEFVQQQRSDVQFRQNLTLTFQQSLVVEIYVLTIHWQTPKYILTDFKAKKKKKKTILSFWRGVSVRSRDTLIWEGREGDWILRFKMVWLEGKSCVKRLSTQLTA